MDGFQRVGVVGCGLMGSGIAEACARAGLDVVVAETTAELVEAGRSRINASLSRAVGAGKLSEEDRDRAFVQIRFTTELSTFADRELVIEAIVERAAEKIALFSALDAIVKDDGAILSSNTSSIPIVRLAMATSRPGSVIGLHFFNPVPVMPLVEVVSALCTDEGTRTRATAFATEVLGKKTIASEDRAGFIVNGLLIPYLLSAVRMLEGGFATREGIDTGMELGCAHPMGPLRLTDFIGVDTVCYIAESMYEEFKDPALVAPPLLLRMVEAGMHGRKSGRGFYEYR